MSNWEKLESIINSNKREINYIECHEVGGIYLSLAYLNNWDVYVYSDSGDIHSVYTYLLRNRIQMKGIVYIEDRFDNCNYHQVKLSDIDNKNNALIVVVGNENNTHLLHARERFNCFIWNKKEKIRKKLIHSFLNNGIENYVFIQQQEMLNVNVISNIRDYEEVGDLYKRNLDRIKSVYYLLFDDYSREVLTEYIRVYMESGTYSLAPCDGRDKYFAGVSDNDSKEELYNHIENEVWVNCGSSIGDTVFVYFANGYDAQCVYAYEGDNKTFLELEKNISKLPQRYFEKVKIVNCFISNDTNWEETIREKITFVNADIEGAEQDLIMTMKDKLISDRPVIALCVYHKPADIFETPLLLNDILNDYYYLLRKYPSAMENCKRQAELVLYAIPKERAAFDVIEPLS